MIALGNGNKKYCRNDFAADFDSSWTAYCNNNTFCTNFTFKNYSEKSFLQVDDSNRLYQSQIEELQRKVKEYENKLSKHQEVNDVASQKNKALIDRLQEEKAMIEVCVLFGKQIFQRKNDYYTNDLGVSLSVLSTVSVFVIYYLETLI